MNRLNKRNAQSMPPRSERGSSGSALLLTLGFLCVLLTLVLTLALTSQTERRSAAAAADAVRSRLLALSALGEAAARIESDYMGTAYPADLFFEPVAAQEPTEEPTSSLMSLTLPTAPAGLSDWEGRQYMASGKRLGNNAGIESALALTMGGGVYTPRGVVMDGAGWVPMRSKRFVHTSTGSTQRDVLVGRFSYLVVDESGKVDPSVVVTRGLSELNPVPVSGSSVAEFSLASLGFANANIFLPDNSDEEFSGLLPSSTGRWLSIDHLVSTCNFGASEMGLAVRTLFPYSKDKEQFWRDRNDNGVYDTGEEADRLDVRTYAELSKVYQLFVGPVQDWNHKNDDGVADAGLDDCAWLKKLDDNPWFASWKTRAFAGYSEPERTWRARSHVAAQVAANIADYADPDCDPTIAYLDSAGQIHVGTGNASKNVVGTERTWALSQIGMRLEADVTIQEDLALVGGPPPVVSGDDVPFDIVSGAVVPRVMYQATAKVLGAQVSEYDLIAVPAVEFHTCAVTARIKLGYAELFPWGGIDDPVDSNIHDANNPRTHYIPMAFDAGTPLEVRAKFWRHPVKQNGGFENTWLEDSSIDTDDDNTRVRVLRDGDTIPEGMLAASDLGSLAYFLEEYVEGNVISLQPNQAIILFEADATWSPLGADFQDLAILITLSEHDGSGIVSGKKVRHTISGLCNINPNNKYGSGVNDGVAPLEDDMEFFMTVADDDSQITRDTLWASRSSYTYPDTFRQAGGPHLGPATWIHVRPKGNSNDNTLRVNGELYILRNGHVYDFISEPDPMEVCLFNDRYDANGRAMGRWWLGIASGTDVIVMEDNHPYFTVVSEDVTTVPPLPEPPADPTDTGNKLRARAGFRVELSYPWAEDAQILSPPQSVQVAYEFELGTAKGERLTYTGVKEVSFDQAANIDGGTVVWTTDFDMDEWLTLNNAFDTTSVPPLVGYTVNHARIVKVVVRDEFGHNADVVPAGSEDLHRFAGAEEVTTDSVYHGSVNAADPFMNDRGMGAGDYDDFWSVYPEAGTLGVGSESSPTGFGTIESYYNSGPYAGIEVQNGQVQRLGALGRIHSFSPCRSLRLWSATGGDEAGHDADILDVFKVGSQAVAYGRVNINTLQPEVLKGLFSDSVDVDVDDAVEAVLARRRSGVTFRTLGDFFGSLAAVTPSTVNADALSEESVTRLAERLTTRQNYFTVVLCAQAVRDVDGVSYVNESGVTTTAEYGTFDVARGERYVDPVVAQQRLLAVVYRDALTNATKVENITFLDE